MEFILSLDAGTSNCRALLLNKKGEVVAQEQKALAQHFPNQGWVEYEPNEIWGAQYEVARALLTKTKTEYHEVKAIGITNQRETTIVWERETSKPIWNAIGWNDRRTKEWCEKWTQLHGDKIYEKTGLYLESYFSASKIAWILDNVSGAREKAGRGELCFGTVNTWLLWNLTKGKIFATDVTNASRTLLFNIHTLSWDQELLDIFKIPASILPIVKSSSEIYGETDRELFSAPIPIASMIGDQQAALFGHACFQKGDVQCTFGTGTFMMMNTGQTPAISKHSLLTTIAWKLGNEPVEYALEGLVYTTGSVIRWLQESIGLIKVPREIEGLAYSVTHSDGVYFVPTLAGITSPYWNAQVRGAFFGLSLSTNIGHIARATLEGIAHRVTEVLGLMQEDAQNKISFIKCGGGMSENVFLMQVQADFMGVPIAKSGEKEVTALGSAYLAGLAVGFWKDKKEIGALWKCDRKFYPQMEKEEVDIMRKKWRNALRCVELFAENA